MRADRRRRAEDGQASAFILCLMFTMVMFVGVVVDVGQATNRRIALQYVADAGAYTGASVMALGNNQIAQWNKFMQYAWTAFTLPGTPIWTAMKTHITECSTADAQETLYYTVMEQLRAVARVENTGYGILARDEAERVSKYNAADLFPGESLVFQEYSDQGFKSTRPSNTLGDIDEVPDGTLPQAVPGGLPAIKELTYICFHGVDVERHVRKYPVWLQRAPGHVDNFAFVVKARKTRAYLFDSLFGGRIIPEMEAIAVAKPVGGSIAGGDDRYRAKMVPAATAMGLQSLPNTSMPSFVPNAVAGQTATINDQKYDRGRRLLTH